jgi:hypothetical protein
MNALAITTQKHPWLAALEEGLDGLESALMQGDAGAVQTTSAGVQGILQRAPRTSEFASAGSTLHADMQQAAQRFGQLRQAVLRATAQSQRAVHSLLPQQTPATYGRQLGQPSSTGGAGRVYLSA